MRIVFQENSFLYTSMHVLAIQHLFWLAFIQCSIVLDCSRHTGENIHVSWTCTNEPDASHDSQISIHRVENLFTVCNINMSNFVVYTMVPFVPQFLCSWYPITPPPPPPRPRISKHCTTNLSIILLYS